MKSFGRIQCVSNVCGGVSAGGAQLVPYVPVRVTDLYGGLPAQEAIEARSREAEATGSAGTEAR